MSARVIVAEMERRNIFVWWWNTFEWASGTPSVKFVNGAWMKFFEMKYNNYEEVDREKKLRDRSRKLGLSSYSKLYEWTEKFIGKVSSGLLSFSMLNSYNFFVPFNNDFQQTNNDCFCVLIIHVIHWYRKGGLW